VGVLCLLVVFGAELECVLCVLRDFAFGLGSLTGVFEILSVGRHGDDTNFSFPGGVVSLHCCILNHLD